MPSDLKSKENYKFDSKERNQGIRRNARLSSEVCGHPHPMPNEHPEEFPLLSLLFLLIWI